MKLREMLVEETLSAYSDRLVKTLNIKRLGSGAYAHVFQHPHYSNVVVKVFQGKDKVYKKYLKWVMAHQSNAYVPQIIEAVPYKVPGGESYTIVFMEKMTPMSTLKFRRWLRDVCGQDAVQAHHDYDWDDLLEEMDSAILLSNDHDLREVWGCIRSFGAKHMDLHSGNVMLRGTQLVFTDPVGATPTGPRVDGLD